jgi:hypothetical protein
MGRCQEYRSGMVAPEPVRPTLRNQGLPVAAVGWSHLRHPPVPGKDRMTGSTAHQDVLGLKHALELGIGITIIVLTIVLSWQW